MTTLVYHNGIMASDSQMTCRDIVSSLSQKKIIKTKNGLAGGSGHFTDIQSFFKHIKHKTEFTPEDNFRGILVKPSGKIFLYEGNKRYKTKETPVAWGSGRDLVLAAIDAGLSVKDAVKTAIRRDIYSGGKVQTVKL